MGFVSRTLRKTMLATTKYVDPKESVLLELGVQNAFSDLIKAEGIDKYPIRNILHRYFREYHTLDLQIEDGVTKVDLSVYQPGLFTANIITNIGTTEHVEYEQGQFDCWKNLHSWLKVGGIMIHELPELGSWPGHGRYYVTREFFQNLENYGYQILELDDHKFDNGNTLWCVIRKVEDIPFMNYETFFSTMSFDPTVPPAGVISSNNPKNLI